MQHLVNDETSCEIVYDFSVNASIQSLADINITERDAIITQLFSVHLQLYDFLDGAL